VKLFHGEASVKLALRRGRWLLAMLAVVLAAQLQAQTRQSPVLSEADLLNYLENIRVGDDSPPLVKLSRAEIEQLRLRIFASPEVSVPILRKLVLDGRVGPSRANMASGGSSHLLQQVARMLTKDPNSARLSPNADRLASPPEPRPGECLVLDVMGGLTTAFNLTADYAAGGQWIGPRPTKSQPSLVFVFRMREGQVDTSDSLIVPLGRVAYLAKGPFETSYDVWSVVLHDGTHLAVKGKRLEETRAGGPTVVRKSYDWFSLKAGEVQGESLYFSGFSGAARSASGKLGRLAINGDEVVSLRCSRQR
jgi:hypothetical protein